MAQTGEEKEADTDTDRHAQCGTHTQLQRPQVGAASRRAQPSANTTRKIVSEANKILFSNAR